MPLLQLATQPANDNQRGALIYFISADNGFMKIGIAVNPRNRVKELQTGCPWTLSLGLCINAPAYGINPFELERILHLSFAPYHHRGEWFRIPEDKEHKRLVKLAWAQVAYPHLYDIYCRRYGKPI